MTTVDQSVIIPIEADTSGFSDAMKDLQVQSVKFGSAFSSTIRSAISGGKSFEETLKSLALKLSGLALSSALKPLEKAVGSLFGSALSGLTLTSPASVAATPFAKGGVVSSPTFFGSGGGLGVMGEAGAEAILPLSRGGDGRLGVRLQGHGAPANVTINISTPDVQGFRKSEGQISALLARTVGRGRRGL